MKIDPSPLPPCRWRGGIRQGRHVCNSERFLGAPNLVAGEFCATCPYVDHVPLPPPRALPCVHLGGVANEGRSGLFACALHGRCSPARDERDAAPACARCPDYLPRDAFGPNSAQMLDRAETFLAAVPDYPAGRYRDRGVVIAGGGDRYFASLYVTVRALRHVGCRLPIQVWYLGRNDEMPADRQALLAPYSVECIDADAVRLRHPARALNGWELKVFATLHSDFEELLFLDADCYPCRDPEFLFDLDDYRDGGAVFWPDMATYDDRLKWPAFGVVGPRRPGSVESGQYVIDKRSSWRPLNLAWFYNDHSDYYYRYCYGDKHTFEVAWTRCGRPFVMWQPVARWVDVAYLHPGPDGRPLFVHRCADKFRLETASFMTAQVHALPGYYPNLPLESECWTWLRELADALRPEGWRAKDALAPEKVVRVGLPGHFNCSLLAHRGRLLLASRQGVSGAEVHLSELGPDFQPRRTRRLAMAHPLTPSGAEDPRLFAFRGRLHCSFIGLDDSSSPRRIHQMVCRLGDDFDVEEVWMPDYADRREWEKNWQFFDHDGELLSVYSIDPHVVLRHRGRRAEVVARTEHAFRWRGHHLRGGAPPVRVGDEYYHFFHSMIDHGGACDYHMGLYTFAARPPFEIRRFTPLPILSPENDWPAYLGKSVVFPCGAVLRGGRWIVSYGYHDRECRIAWFDAGQVEGRLHQLEIEP